MSTTQHHTVHARSRRRPQPAEKLAAGLAADAEQRLKAERIQALSALAADQRLKAERIQERLRALPGWRLIQGGRALDRVREFPGPRAAAGYAAHVAELAEMLNQPVAIKLAGDRVVVTLHGHPRRGHCGGLTESVLDFAASLG